MGAHPKQMIEQAGDLGKHHADVLGTHRDLQPSIFSSARQYAFSLHIIDM
jgi:hypothetical protein